MRLLNISLDDDSAEDGCEEIFKSDPALTAELLLLSNSAFYGRRTQIQTIRNAMKLLGLERVRCLAVSIALRSQMSHGARPPYLATVWAHSIAAAVAAEAMGAVYESPGMYTLGLTHDLGRLGLFLVQGPDYARELSVEFSGIAEANEAELRLYGMTHCEAGALVARGWGLPESLGACMANHHDRPGSHDADPETLIWRACRMADSLGFLEVPQSEAPAWPDLPPAMRNRPELEPETLWDEINRRIADLAN
jgi:HD-like signal output (HDOD) protein